MSRAGEIALSQGSDNVFVRGGQGVDRQGGLHVGCYEEVESKDSH